MAKGNNSKEEIRKAVLTLSLNIFEGINQNSDFWKDFETFIEKKSLSGTPSNTDL